MSVYVDESIWPYGRMMMCHMVADSRAELDEMADKIKVPRKWIQKPGTDREHYDICKSKRALAVEAGAREVTCFELVSIVRADGRPVR
jgi:hypothetical protein